jgi:hypothetical protein
MNENQTLASAGPVDIKLGGAAYLKSFPERSPAPTCLTYDKGREALTYQIDCDLWEGKYWLKKAHECGSKVPGPKRQLSVEASRLIIKEVIAHLQTHGVPADECPYEDWE